VGTLLIQVRVTRSKKKGIAVIYYFLQLADRGGRGGRPAKNPDITFFTQLGIMR